MTPIAISLLILSFGMMTDRVTNYPITGTWVLTRFVTEEATVTNIKEKVIVVFEENGRYLVSPEKTPLEEQTNSYTFDGKEIWFFKYDPKTDESEKLPYSKYEVLTLNKTELQIVTIETDGKPPKSYQVMEYFYKRK